MARLFTFLMALPVAAVATWASARSESAVSRAPAHSISARAEERKTPTPAVVRQGVLPSKSSTGAQPLSRRPELRRLFKREVSHAIVLEARAVLDAHHRDPFGTEIAFEVGGKPYVARIEQHFHPPGGEKKPWGLHPGVSVLVAR